MRMSGTARKVPVVSVQASSGSDPRINSSEAYRNSAAIDVSTARPDHRPAIAAATSESPTASNMTAAKPIAAKPIAAKPIAAKPIAAKRAAYLGFSAGAAVAEAKAIVGGWWSGGGRHLVATPRRRTGPPNRARPRTTTFRAGSPADDYRHRWETVGGSGRR